MLNIVMLTAYTEVDTCKKTNISGLNVGNNYYYNTFSLSIASYIYLYTKKPKIFIV